MVNQENNEQLRPFAKGRRTELKKGGRAVIYQRVSSKEQEFGFSPEVQIEVCRKWADRNGYEVVKSFEGEYESAKSDVNRKRFKQMLDFVKDRKNKIDAVIVYSTSRFSRTGVESFSIVEELKKKGITVFSATSSYDARTPDGEMMQGYELVQARHDNAVKSQAVKDASEKALRSGRWITRVPIGYDMVTTRKEQTISVNTQGVLIRKAFKMKADENLTNEEVRVRMKNMGLNFDKQKWSRIFSNIFYAGYFSHPFLQGDIIKGPHEPLVSLENFFKVNNITMKTHSRGYETKTDKEYAPLLGSIRCPVCGHNLTASVSTKLRKLYGREVGYYVCCRKNCKCNVSAKKANADFEQWLDGVSLPEGMVEMLEAQLRKAFPILNRDGHDEVAAIKANLTKKENEIERVEFNFATAATLKAQEVCLRQLEKLEAERAAIKAQLDEKDREILNLGNYIKLGLELRRNILKLWQLSSLSQKRHIQNLVFPDGLVWDKKNDHIEPLSRNGFMFVYDLKSRGYMDKEKGQTLISEDLSGLAPLLGLEPRTP